MCLFSHFLIVFDLAILLLTPCLRKRCKFAYRNYKLHLDKAKASKVENSQELKRKLKIYSIRNIKKQKLQLQECTNSLKEGF